MNATMFSFQCQYTRYLKKNRYRKLGNFRYELMILLVPFKFDNLSKERGRYAISEVTQKVRFDYTECYPSLSAINETWQLMRHSTLEHLERSLQGFFFVFLADMFQTAIKHQKYVFKGTK